MLYTGSVTSFIYRFSFDMTMYICKGSLGQFNLICTYVFNAYLSLGYVN